jgi:hypothetical protein
VIGRIREDILFHENGINLDVKLLPKYDDSNSKKYSWTISQAPYFMWSTDCESKMQASSNDVMKDIKNSLNSVQGHESLYMYSEVYLILSLCTLGFYIYLAIMNKCKCFVFCYIIIYFLEVLVFLAIAVFLILMAVSLSKMNSVFLSQQVKGLSIDLNSDCSDFVGNIILLDF